MANYLPVLLVSVTTNAIPDDSSLSTQPRGQVDYLSHEWREEDVWRSWRNMTRQKNEIANGVRLENASWRTWWKQRNKLKTVSPETLNWLKDSDLKSDSPTVDKQCNFQSHCGVNSPPDHPSQLRSKPILKHRSISDLLTSALPTLNHTDDDFENDLEILEDEDDLANTPPARPPLLHTKSDSNVTRWSYNRPFRKVSPPRIIAPTHERSGSSDSARETTSSSQDLSMYPAGGKKKHISFNTFVEQCIAIDSPPKPYRGSLPGEAHGLYNDSYDDGYEEDSEIELNDPDDALDEGGLFSEGHNGSDSDEEEEILEMRTSLSRSRSSSSSRSPGAPGYPRRAHPFSYPHSSHPLVRSVSSEKEHVTIAPIAPTLLKTTGVGNHFVVTDLGGQRTTFTPPVILYMFLPLAVGMHYHGKPLAVFMGSRFSSSPGTSTSASSDSRSPPPAIPAAEALPIPRVLSPPAMESPMGAREESYEYFVSTAAAQVLSADLPVNIRQADLGAGFDPDIGALGVRLGRAVDMPEVVVVNDETGAIEERQSRTPSPAETMAATTEPDSTRIRTTPSPFPPPQDSSHLSPDSHPPRGRTPPGVPPRSRSFTNDGHSSSSGDPSRGRSATRNSSFSDRECSSSRTSLVSGTGSPLGSVSPTGSGAGGASNGMYSAYSQGRNIVRRGSGSAESMDIRERGRSSSDCRASVSETSMSPPRKGTPHDGRSLDAAIANASPIHSPSPSTSTPPSSTTEIDTFNTNTTPPITEDKSSRPAPSTHSPSVLRHVSLAVPVPPAPAPASVHAQKPQSSTPAPSARDSLTPPSSPTEHGTLVGRAAEIVSAARGLFGALWSGSSSNSPGVP
ncbi:hypothetical protein B0F90DRAFT_1814683 [Multifurca ochricompacta]|uniref:Nitrogen regulatory protein areA GATA-like domain-containing protein n=1 Tax=Multifurca ochricompacta TaxID=376703 RepID=A0AAD4MA36_9AGAM|nr:hypothetical protein B0F90DRAFT_1814683 [Multifurca ochricompacta]